MMLASNKLTKWLLLAGAAAVLGLGIFFTVDYMLHRSVTFNLAEGVNSIVIYSSEYTDKGADATKITSLTKSGVVRLKDGTYYISPTGSHIITDAFTVTVGHSTTSIDINPYYSADYLSTHFAGELDAIHSIITDNYRVASNGYKLETGTFYHYGEWYGTILYKSPDVNGAYDFYGVILHKVDGKWQVAASPKIIFTYTDYLSIPKDILSSVNAAVSGF